MKCVTLFLTVAFSLNSIATVLAFSRFENVHKTHHLKTKPSYPAVSRIYRGSVYWDCGKSAVCVRRCCGVNYYLDKNETCVYNDSSSSWEVDIFKYGTVIVDDESIRREYLHGMVGCAFDKKEGQLWRPHFMDFYVQLDGKLWIPDLHRSLDFQKYCVELTDEGPRIFFCSFDDIFASMLLSQDLNVLGMAISLPFLLITFIVYAILPLRNLHGTCLMCYIFALFVTYVIHIFNYFYMKSDNATVTVCRITKCLTMFFFMSSFFWMNVMSYDLWRAFSGSVNLRTAHKKSEWKTFLLYSSYAWLLPLAIVGLVLSLSRNVKPYSWYDPGLTDKECIVRDGIPTLIYYYGPMAILLVANTVLFTGTAGKIIIAHRGTLILQEGDNSMSHRNNTKRFYVYLKLYLVMGINWSMEVVSYIVSWNFNTVPRSAWYLTDFCNSAYGVAIFLIFICKEDIWKLLKQRCRSVTEREVEPAALLSLTARRMHIQPGRQEQTLEQSLSSDTA